MSERELTVITNLSQIPDFQSEKEEAEFWATHSLAADLYTPESQTTAEALLPPAQPRPAKSNPTSLRLGVDLERRLRILAERKNTTYQTLLKEFVLERVYEEEKRLKII